MEIEWKHYALPAVAAVAYGGWLLLRPAAVSQPSSPASMGEHRASTNDATTTAGSRDGSISIKSHSQERADRNAMRERISAALGRRTSSGAGSAVVPAGSTAQVAQLDPVWVRERIIQDLVPAAERCYLARREQNPSLQVRIDMALTFMGHESVGTVVDEIEVVAASLDDADLVECVRKSILALAMAPPRLGGTRTVDYTLAFAPPDATGG